MWASNRDEALALLHEAESFDLAGSTERSSLTAEAMEDLRDRLGLPPANG
jgi:hypothetical protein